MRPRYTLISHKLCPYVQRVAIVLAEKNIEFQRVDIDLNAKPNWFLAISPLGKTPVLQVDDAPIFESAVICEFLDDTAAPRLHPEDPLLRSRHRAWMEFGSQLLNGIAGFYSATSEAALFSKVTELANKFDQIEAVLGAGPYFQGEHFSMVDAVFGPIFRYFDVFDSIEDFQILANKPRVSAWRHQLAARPSIISAVGSDYAKALRHFLRSRNSTLARRLQA